MCRNVYWCTFLCRVKVFLLLKKIVMGMTGRCVCVCLKPVPAVILCPRASSCTGEAENLELHVPVQAGAVCSRVAASTDVAMETRTFVCYAVSSAHSSEGFFSPAGKRQNFKDNIKAS